MSENQLVLYFKKEPENDRFFPKDHLIIPKIRELIKGKKIGGVEKVFINLCKGLDKLGVKYQVNTPFHKLKEGQVPVALGTGKYILQGYKQKNKVIAGIGLMTHPSEWPDLLKEFPVVRYLQHCEWAANVYKPWYGDKVCDTWFAGIETEKWAPSSSPKNTDILIYNKIRWNKEKYQEELVQPIKEILRNRGLSYKEIVYGFYKEEDYHSLLKECKSMIFLCEHESQGFACCEAMSMNIPVLAWDQGYCLDPNRFKWGEPKIPASSVPFFSEKCGERFSDINDFSHSLPGFWQKVSEGFYEPRTYILDNLTLEKSAERMLDIVRTSLQNN